MRILVNFSGRFSLACVIAITVPLGLTARAFARPSQSRFRDHAHLPKGQVVAEAVRRLPELGTEIYKAKVIDPGLPNFTVVTVSLTEDGEEVDEPALVRTDGSERWKRASKFSDALIERMTTATSNEEYLVQIEPPTAWSFKAREDIIGDPIALENHLAIREAIKQNNLTSLRAAVTSARGTLISSPKDAGYIVGKFSRDSLLALQHSADVGHISELQPITTSLAVTGYNYIKTCYHDAGPGFLGTGWSIGVHEINTIFTRDLSSLGTDILTQKDSGIVSDPHPGQVVGIIRNLQTTLPSIGGVAHGVNPIYLLASTFPDPSRFSSPPEHPNEPVRVVNLSVATGATEESSYNFAAVYRIYDQATLDYPYTLYVYGAGNEGNSRIVLNKTFNGLLVGGSEDDPSLNDDGGTRNRSNDLIWVGSHTRNPLSGTSIPHGDVELPHITAPSSHVTSFSTYPLLNGTSYAAPQASGAAIRLIQRNQNLSSWPEATKAILMASADATIGATPLDMADSIDDVSGAGELNVLTALVVADPTFYTQPQAAPAPLPGSSFHSSTGHFYGSYCGATSDWFVRPSSSGVLRVAVTFDAVPTASVPGTTPDHMALPVDVDLFLLKVVNNQDTTIKVSATFDSAFEYVQASVDANQLYRIRIIGSGGNGTTGCTYMAAAWNLGGT